MTKRWLAVGLVLLGSVEIARADDASKRAKVEELVTVMHMDRLTQQMTAAVKMQVDQLTKQMSTSDRLTPAQKQAVADFQDKSLKLVGDSMSWDQLKGDFINLYVQTFSEDEISGMVTFYKSPSGQAVLTKMPQLTSASMKLVQQRVLALQPKLKELQDQFLVQMDKGAPAPASNSSGSSDTTPASKSPVPKKN